MNKNEFRVGIEVGGTFTDLVASDGYKMKTAKVPSTPSNPDEGAMNAIRAAELDISKIKELVHGSTVATNAVLERKGGRICFFVTKGTRDILLLQRHDRRSIYDLHYKKPEPVVARHDTYEIKERISADGSIVLEIDKDHARQQVKTALRDGRFDSAAICFLHSYTNSQHEGVLKELIQQEFPSLPITCSCDVTREFREYERASTTTLAAYVQPVIAGYIKRFSASLAEQGFKGRFSIMQSNGGRMPAEAMAKNAISALFSGPAAGVVGAIRGISSAGYRNLITLDMGGTSTDVSLVSDGESKLAPMTMIDGLPVKTPVIDIATVGAGGGSIAWRDDGGLMRVGPRSAGASPGPACYGRGGVEPTVTDAHLIRGTLQADGFLGGKMDVDVKLAQDTFTELSEFFGLSIEEIADNTIRLAEANIVRAVQQISTERGSDPRDFVLVPFGGAGPLHAARVAEDLSIERVVVPPNAGVLSASGLLLSDHIHYRTRTRRLTLKDENIDDVKNLIGELEKETADYLTSLNVEGKIEYDKVLEMRYVGQAFEVSVDIKNENINELTTARLSQLFAVAHHQVFEFSKADGDPVEIISFRIGAKVSPEALFAKETRLPFVDTPGCQQVKMIERGKELTADLKERAELTSEPINGPVLVQDTNSTIFVPEEWKVSRDSKDNVILVREN
ncbi:MAG: hydantoinase/oxoprolinase family protein [Thalassobaculaceae bacterium]